MGAHKIAATLVKVGKKWETLDAGPNIQEQRMAVKGLYNTVGKGSTCIQILEASRRPPVRRFLDLPKTVTEIKALYAKGAKVGQDITNARAEAANKANEERIAAKQAKAKAHQERAKKKAGK